MTPYRHSEDDFSHFLHYLILRLMFITPSTTKAEIANELANQEQGLAQCQKTIVEKFDSLKFAEMQSLSLEVTNRKARITYLRKLLE